MCVRQWLRRRASVHRGRVPAGRGRASADRSRASVDRGMITAEYALGTLAACAAAAVLYKVLSGGAVEAALRALIGKALGVHV
nr:DUF4244 domain-containing protein [Streptomyces sp. CB02923]